MKDGAEKAAIVELKVSMHCKACERSVLHSLRSLKDLEELKKRTGRRVEIVTKRKGDETGDNVGGGGAVSSSSGGSQGLDCGRPTGGDSGHELLVSVDMFSDENPNACCIT
ncbi:unnamed protein product [Spirodela intermedia]|uniref:Uncharacterized protein n=1 Tax=Spirodela intermedia TaxID=51605 RepID=A0A7I8J0M4_SPIIN|nr:unnamed protein product [Spirodela intermedia]CAA6663363.1 unnamed protein product [Spirodela intermedia]